MLLLRLNAEQSHVVEEAEGLIVHHNLHEPLRKPPELHIKFSSLHQMLPVDLLSLRTSTTVHQGDSSYIHDAASYDKQNLPSYSHGAHKQVVELL